MNNFLIGIRRLIYGFQKQTRETIWQYMDELATESDIYSKELKDFCPEVANDRLFVYASNHNLVVVLLDTSGREEKTGPEARVKAVLNIIETRLENSRHYVSLFGVVLTGKTIKEPALSPLDEEFAEIKVFDKMTKPEAPQGEALRGPYAVRQGAGGGCNESLQRPVCAYGQ